MLHWLNEPKEKPHIFHGLLGKKAEQINTVAPVVTKDKNKKACSSYFVNLLHPLQTKCTVVLLDVCQI